MSYWSARFWDFAVWALIFAGIAWIEGPLDASTLLLNGACAAFVALMCLLVHIYRGGHS